MLMSVEQRVIVEYAYCVGMPHHVQLKEAGIDGSHKQSTEHLQEP
jgi:hypothetical protein